jgi:hypothetical protein
MLLLARKLLAVLSFLASSTPLLVAAFTLGAAVLLWRWLLAPVPSALFRRKRSAILSLLASYRTVLVATLSACASAFLGLWLQSGKPWPWAYPFVVAEFCLVVAGITPSQYARVALLESLLPAIHKVLGLGPEDRVTIHHIRSRRRQLYEQLTDYHPTRAGRGRTFGFAYGIAGQCFGTAIARCYSVPAGSDFKAAMRDRWTFTEDDLSRVNQTRRSFFAFPVGRNGQFAMAVLYMDSDDPHRFTDESREATVKRIQEIFLPQLEQILLS